jgi:putative addiction module component (TIGR02574 family)
MSITLAELEQKAIALSPEDRARFALSLIQSLEPIDEGDVADAWRIEAERRWAEIESGKARLVAGDEVFENVRGRLRLLSSGNVN